MRSRLHKLTLGAAIALLLSGCVTAPTETSPGSSPPLVPTTAAAKSAPQTAPLAPANADGNADELPGGDKSIFTDDAEPQLRPEDFEEGFCVDDIYAKYLTVQYAAAHPTKKRRPTKRVARRRRRHHRRRVKLGYDKHQDEFAALSYARERMSGPTSSYFGAIPIVVNKRVDYWIQYYKTAGRHQFMRWLVRGEAVKRMVQPILQEGGVPIEFFYLAMIESGFSNVASSPARAAGTWQFMRGTARLYGLKVNHWVDERRDPVKSSIAAVNYLKDLYADLGDWYLAMAAYNAGPGKIRRAIKEGGTEDFWRLAETRYLAKETKHYVPKVLAAILLATEAKAHGFDVQADTSAYDLPETAVIVKRPMRLTELSKKLGLPVTTLKRWNPELIRGYVPPTKNGYSLRLADKYARVFQAVESHLVASDIKDVELHRVRKGETLSRIAHKYRVKIKQILSANPGLDRDRIKPGRTITIPLNGIVTSRSEAGNNEIL